MKQVCHLSGLCMLILALWVPSHVEGQFIPPELSADIPSRLIFRPQGLVEAWKDPDARRAVVRGQVTLDPTSWQQQFAGSGGIAVVGPSSQGLDNFTVSGETSLCGTADKCVSAADSSQFSDDRVPPQLNFASMPNAMMIVEGGFLRFDNIIISDIAGTDSYQYSESQPYRSVGIGTGTWPTISMAPGSRLVLINVTLVYKNPSSEDTCEQCNQRAIYSLQQVYGVNNVTVFNKTAANIPRGLIVSVKVFNGSDSTPLGEARTYLQNVTMSCIVPPPPGPSGKLSTGALAAAIAVPVAASLLLSLAVCLCLRRRNRRRRAGAAAAPAAKDVEAGHAVFGSDATRHAKSRISGQLPGDDAQDKVVPLGIFTGSSAQASSQHSSGHYQTGSYPGSSASAPTSSASTAPPTPAVGVGGSAAAAAGNVVSPPTTGSGEDRAQMMSPPVLAIMQNAGGASFNSTKAAAAAAAAQAGPGPAADASAHGQIALHNPSAENNPNPLLLMDSMDAPGSLGLAGTGSTTARSWPLSSEEPPTGPDSGGGANSDSRNASVIRDSGSCDPSGHGTGSAGNSGGGRSAGIFSGSPSAAGGKSSRGGSTVALYDRANNVSGLLKIRSDMAVLRDLKIGPLLGRGSYGRVYKGRWKTVTVAVKIIEHHEGSPGTANSGGKTVDVGRETLLATSMAHPNVVQTYHISTMSVSQRNALATSWLEAQDSKAGTKSRRNSRSKAGTTLETEDYANDSSSDEVQKDPVETWMLMEFCEKGSIERAIGRGKFIRKDNKKPEMIGIYKALLDTASGLDYLHSIGVVHGDLKTANVLLKGSARDVRGFACKITDFGLSRVLDLDATHISTRTYGTIVYMPSELLLTGRMTQATDIYSFGLMMWELYTSTRVFEEGLSIGQIFYMIAYQNWRPAIPPGCPPGFAALMAACWNQNPEQRPTVQQLLRSLQSLYMAEKKAMAAARDLAKKDILPPAARAAAGGGPDRNSIESDKSDRYRNAAAASKEDFIEDLVVARPAAVDSAAYRSMAAAMPSSAAAADAQQWHYMQQQQNAWPDDSIPTAELFPGGMVPAANSFGEAQGSGGSLATIDYYPQGGSGGGKPGHGSGDTVATLDGISYQPWAEAVTQDPDNPNSAGSLDISGQDSAVSPAGLCQQQQQWSQQGAFQADIQYPHQQVPVTEIQPAEDYGLSQSPAAGPRYSIQGPVDEQQLRLQEHLHTRTAQPTHNLSDAAQGFVEAIEMVTKPGTAGSSSPCAAAAPPMVPHRAVVPSTSSRQTQYQYQQRPVALQQGGNSVGSKAGLPSNLPTLPSGAPSGLTSGCSSISTGTLPAVIGDSPIGSCATSLPGSFAGPGSLPGHSGGRWPRSSGSSRREGSMSTSATGVQSISYHGGAGSPSDGSGMPPLSSLEGAMPDVPSPRGVGLLTHGGTNVAGSSMTQGSPFAHAVADDAPAGAGSATAAATARPAGGDNSTRDAGESVATFSPFAMLAHRGESLFKPL